VTENNSGALRRFTKANNPPDNFKNMKTFKQKKKRCLARRKARNAKFVYKFSGGFNHLHPAGWRERRSYILKNDAAGVSVYYSGFTLTKSEMVITNRAGGLIECTSSKRAALKMSDMEADHFIHLQKGLGGAWRAIRVK
jgi:hypothetical protein